MKNEKLIFGFFAEGDNARVELNGTGEEIVSGLVMLLHSNKSMGEMMKAAMEVYDKFSDDLDELIANNNG